MQFMIYISCFLMLYLILWHILPLLLSFVMTISLKALGNRGLILLSVLCESGILSVLLALRFPNSDFHKTYHGLTKEEYQSYQSFQKTAGGKRRNMKQGK